MVSPTFTVVDRNVVLLPSVHVKNADPVIGGPPSESLHIKFGCELVLREQSPPMNVAERNTTAPSLGQRSSGTGIVPQSSPSEVSQDTEMSRRHATPVSKAYISSSVHVRPSGGLASTATLVVCVESAHMST